MARALKVCSTDRCPELVPKGTSRCPACETKGDRIRGTARQRGYTARWDRYRAAYLRTHLWCTEPRCGLPATDVDHIDGLGPKGARGYDITNLRALCHAHHSARTARDQPGGWARR